MEDPDILGGLRGLYQDLSALSDSSLLNIDRLVFELETHIEDFKKLIDKPTKNNASRQAVLSGKIKVADVEYAVNEQFQQGALQLADTLEIDELEAALLFLTAQDDSKALDRTPLVTALVRFHERRHFLLECLRLILQESFESDRDKTQSVMQEVVAHILEIKDGPLRNASLYARKVMGSMEEVERQLILLSERVQKASIVGQVIDPDLVEALEYERTSLEQQHESLGAILFYLFKGTYTSAEDLRFMLNRLRKLDRFDMLLVHYIPAIIASFVQHGSPEGSGSHKEARSLYSSIVASKDSQPWSLPTFHATVTALWLSVYGGWYLDLAPSSPVHGSDLEKDAEDRTKQFMTALDDGALELLLTICSGTHGDEWSDPARSELVSLLLKDSAVSLPDSTACAAHFRALLMENIEVFAESCIANMPDAVRRLKSEEDSQRLDQITSLRDGLNSNLHRGSVEARTHLETFLMVMAFAFEHRQDAAQEFWADPDGNLYGFLQWASKRQTVPRVSAFSQLLCSISEGEENAAAAHRFLSDEDKVVSVKFKRSASMNWAQMFAELQLYASKVTEKPSTLQTSLRARKFEPADMTEPESPVMLTCYLRLIGHLSKQSGAIRDWMLHHPSLNIVSILLMLCSGPIPSHLRATTFTTLAALMTNRTTANGNEMWLAIDQWISGGSLSISGPNKVPVSSNNPTWYEQQAFQKIGESFDQMNAFVVLLHTLISPTAASIESPLWLPFPESLAASYRMPGIEPYVDFVLGQAFSKKLPDLSEGQNRTLTVNCLGFVVTCLRTFNEPLVTALSQHASQPDLPSQNAALMTYIRLHPFARVAEWLFNEDVIKALFATARQNVDEVNRAPTDSPLVNSLLRSIEVMNLILDLQSTYFHVIRPVIKSQAPGSRLQVSNAALSSFEDALLGNLSIVPQLCLYCGSGHQQLVVESLALLEKLSSSRKLNKMSSPELLRWQSSNRIMEVLSTEVVVDSVSRPLMSQMQPDLREIELGPEAAGYVIRESLLALLNSCLAIFPDQPTVAHLLMGFTCVGSALDVAPDSLFSNGMSLLHSIIGFLQAYPDGTDGTPLPWMLHIKRLALEVLRHLWTSKLSSYFTLAEMRASRFLADSFSSQMVVNSDTLWAGLPTSAEGFWLGGSADALIEFLLYRSYLYGYAATELRAAAKLGSPTLQSEILSTLFGSSSSETGEIIHNPTVFDLFDFSDLDIPRVFKAPRLHLLGDIDDKMWARPQENESLVLYDEAGLDEFIQLRKRELWSAGQLRPQDDEQYSAEAASLKAFVSVDNRTRRALYNRRTALRSWTELITTILASSNLDSTRKSTVIHQTIQLLLPKLEISVEDQAPEATELAHLAELLISNLKSGSFDTTSGRHADVINEKLYQLFQTCMRGIMLASHDSSLRETFFNICSLYVSRITSPAPTHEHLRRHSRQLIKTNGTAIIEAICDDAYAGQDTCRLSALVLLNQLAALDCKAEPVLADLISQSNYLSLFLDALKILPRELSSAQAEDIASLLSYYESLLSLLQGLSHTKKGATHVLDAGLFHAVRESGLFAADPDIGITMRGRNSLRPYYELLVSVMRVIVSAVFMRGVHNEQTIEHTRSFLAENRPNMVGIFKRFARIGGTASADTAEILQELVKSYMILIAVSGFLDIEETELGARTEHTLFT